MYRGQKPKSKNPSKRRKPRRKNPSMGAKLGIGFAVAAIAAAAGGGFYYWRKKKKDSAVLPPEGGTSGKKKGGKKKGGKAPEMPHSEATLEDKERNAVAAVMQARMPGKTTKIPMSEANKLTDKAFYSIFPDLEGKKIPPAPRDATWQGYVDSWVRMNATIKETIKSWNYGVETGAWEKGSEMLDDVLPDWDLW